MRIHERMYDGCIAHARMSEGIEPPVLILPDPTESIENPLYHALEHTIGHKTYAIEPRGSKLSLSRYDENMHRKDIEHWIGKLTKAHGGCIVLAKGATAGMMLEYERLSHKQRKMPPLARAMVLLDPSHGRPVRVQTPTVIFSGGMHPSVSGSLQFRRAHWLHSREKLPFLKGVREIADSISAISRHEEPIRFRI